jgi:PAS domain S-box-containing protein
VKEKKNPGKNPEKRTASRKNKSVEALLQVSSEKYRNILENMQEGYFELDLAGNFTFFNDSITRIYKFSKEELLGLNYKDYTDKRTARKLFRIFSGVYKTGKPVKEATWSIICKDGTKIYVEGSASLLKDSSGNPIGFSGIIHDITRRRWTEKALIEREAQYRLLADHMKDQVWLIDFNFKPIFVSPSFIKLLGYSLEELRDLAWDKILTKESLKQATDLVSQIAPLTMDSLDEILDRTVEMELYCKNGGKVWLEIRCSFIRDENGNAVSILGESRDITERKQAEAALVEREIQYRLLADHMKDQVWLTDLNLKPSFLSPSFEKLLGYSIEDLKALSWSTLLTPESLKKVRGILANVSPLTKDTPDDIFDRTEELEVCCRNGRTVWVEVVCSFIRDENGNAISILGESRDITERKQMEDALKKSEERYRSVFKNAGLPLVIMENSLQIFMINDRFKEISGYNKREVEGRMKFTDFIDAEDKASLLKYFSKNGGNNPEEYECRIAHRNGDIFDVLVRIGRMPDAGQFIASFTDITSRKQAEAALLESQESLQKENIRLRSSIRERYRFCDIIGKSRGMQAVYEFILQAAATPANVIIYGESGTGKELVANAIHETSGRSQKGFVTVHCGAIPETLMESEFFGYKKGAFTGANVDKLGYLDEADGGTLFLDEIGEIGLNMQVKLLRAISGDGYTPVGSNLIRKADIRIIAATNRNLKDLVRRGIMREDFFYRIHILPIYIPPLRERKDDLPLLIDHFLETYDKEHPPLPGFIVEALVNHDWPGNVRELQNVLYRYMTLKRLDFEGLPPERPASAEVESVAPFNNAPVTSGLNGTQAFPAGKSTINNELPGILKDLEREHILKVLTENKWHRTRTAAALGINRKTLFRKMQKFGIKPS